MLGASFDARRGGTTFRYWAPNAKRVDVQIRKAGVPASSAALAKAPDDYWSSFLPGVNAGDEYTYLLHDAGGNRFDRLDPAARDTLQSALQPQNAGIVVDPSMSWSNFTTPRFEDFIIYQLHVGAFSGRNDHCRTWPARFGDVQTKLQYIKDLAFNAIELLPVQEFCLDRSWGYNPSFYFAPESGYGSPSELRSLVDEAHKRGLAVLFDVVFNHVSDDDNSLDGLDVYPSGNPGIYLQAYRTPWGSAPAFWKDDVKAFFLANAEMYLDEYNGDGLRFDATRAIESAAGWGNDGWRFLQHLTWSLKQAYPGKYLVAEHLPDDLAIIDSAGFHATWVADAHHEFQRAAGGDDAVRRLRGIVGKDFGDRR